LWALLRRKIIVNTIFFASDVVTGVVVAANIVNADAEVVTDAIIVSVSPATSLFVMWRLA